MPRKVTAEDREAAPDHLDGLLEERRQLAHAFVKAIDQAAAVLRRNDTLIAEVTARRRQAGKSREPVLAAGERWSAGARSIAHNKLGAFPYLDVSAHKLTAEEEARIVDVMVGRDGALAE